MSRGQQKTGITIKGTHEGLVFFFDDDCPFNDLLTELQQKLSGSSQIWNGPQMNVKIRLGQRGITPPEKEAIRELFSARENLIIQSFESDHQNVAEDLVSPPVSEVQEKESSKKIPEFLLAGTVRSGQVLTYQGDLLFMGDVNPGGAIHCTGSIYVMGVLRGIAHAGKEGNTDAIIVASILLPTQLRIADVLSRPPEDWETSSEQGARFAYVAENRISVDKVCYFDRIRPGHTWWAT